MVGHDRSVGSLTPRIEPGFLESYLPGWFLVVGPDGRRLFDETAHYGVTIALARNAGGRVFGVFDAEALAANGSSALPTFKAQYPPGTPLPARVWSTDSIRQMVASGQIFEEPSLDGVAQALDIPATTVRGTVARYNELAGLRVDLDFRKDASFLRAINQPPFYGVELRPAGLGSVQYGIEIDQAAQVIGQTAEPIGGLFAAGECTGGVMGPFYVGAGNNLTSSLVFGRVAGHSAAGHAMNEASPSSGSTSRKAYSSPIDS
jgi:fumarate reductase flavoprotein subunit